MDFCCWEKVVKFNSLCISLCNKILNSSLCFKSINGDVLTKKSFYEMYLFVVLT